MWVLCLFPSAYSMRLYQGLVIAQSIQFICRACKHIIRSYQYLSYSTYTPIGIIICSYLFSQSISRFMRLSNRPRIPSNDTTKEIVQRHHQRSLIALRLSVSPVDWQEELTSRHLKSSAFTSTRSTMRETSPSFDNFTKSYAHRYPRLDQLWSEDPVSRIVEGCC